MEAAPSSPESVITPASAPRTIAQVHDWLCANGFSQYAQAFSVNEVSGHMLRTLTSAELRDDLHMANLAHRHRLLALLASLPAAHPPSPPRPAERADTAAADRAIGAFRPPPQLTTRHSQPGPPQLPAPNSLPEHGRILDHLSNVRTYHSWVRVGVQLCSFALVTLRLAPDYRDDRFVVAMASYLAVVGVLSLVYAALRYRAVVRMIDSSTITDPQYLPDRIGVISLLVFILAATVLSIVMIALDPPAKTG